MIISGPVGDIEMSCTVPENHSEKIAIICHPHPLYGGTMNNKVVTTVARAFNDLGYITIRFNFRGVGNSAGHYDNGKGEMEDLEAVIQWVRNNYSNYALSLGGFSFGAFIAAKIAVSETIEKLVLVAPPVNHFDFSHLFIPRGLPRAQSNGELSKQFNCPVIVVQGDQDEVVPANEVIAWAENLSPPAILLRFPNATHFFHGQLIELRETLKKQLMLYPK